MRSDNMMALHANNHYHYSNKLVSGTNQSVEHTYNAEIECAVDGATEQETTVQGANLLDLEKCELRTLNYTKIDSINQNTISVSNNQLDNSNIRVSFSVLRLKFVEKGTTYYCKYKARQLSGDASVIGRPHISVYSGSDTGHAITHLSGARATADDTEYSFSFCDNTADPYTNILFYSQTTATYAKEEGSALFYDVMISTNDVTYEPFVPDSPSPSYPQPIQSAKGEIKCEGRNLYSYGDITTFWAVPDNNLKTLINSLKAGTYTISAKFTLLSYTGNTAMSTTDLYGMKIFSSSNVIGKTFQWGTTQIGCSANYIFSFTLTDDIVGKIANFYTYGSGNDKVGRTGNAMISNIALYKGSYTAETIPPYQPYQPPTSIQPPELRAIKDIDGNITCKDTARYIGNGDWEIKRFVGVKAVDGSVARLGWSTTGKYKVFYVDVFRDKRTNMPRDTVALCTNCYPTTHFDGGYAGKGSIWVLKNNDSVPIMAAMNYLNSAYDLIIKDDTSQTVEEFKAKLAGMGLEVWYWLNEPTIEILHLGDLKSHPHHTDLTVTAEEGYLLPSSVECTYKVYKE